MAAAITTGIVQKRDVSGYSVLSGSTERRLYEGFVQGTKASQSDWFAATAFTTNTANFVSFDCFLKCATTNDYCTDTVVYYQDNGRIVLQGVTASAATAFLRAVWFDS